MRQFKINKQIVLNFLTYNDSEDWLIMPNENSLIVVDGNTIFYHYDGIKKESNNTISYLNEYIKDGHLTEIQVERKI